MAAHRTILLLMVALTGSAFAVAGIACGDVGSAYSCPDPIPGRLDHNGHHDPCCYVDPCHDEDAGAKDSGADAQEDADAGPPPDDAGLDGGEDAAADAHADAAPACPGACIHAPPLGWSDPAVLWLGAMGTPAPSCPTEAPVVGFQGFADLDAPPASCGACSCASATATCGLPASVTVTTAACNPGGGVVTSFDPPASWDGSCTTSNAVAAGQMCGALPCAKSLTAGPLTVQNEACAAVAQEPSTPTPPVTWQTAVLACKRGSLVPCDDPTQVCSPVVEPPPGFALCVFQAGDVDCPTLFPEKHAVAAGADDQRGCSSCTCGTPTGGACTSTLYVFSDDACATSLLSMPIVSPAAPCIDIASPPAGPPALGSKRADSPKYLPGACAPSGGEATGQALPTGPATFCCLP
jgi:hypothetical protein